MERKRASRDDELRLVRAKKATLLPARILYRDEDRDPVQLLDVWTPAVLVSASELARSDDVQQLALTSGGGLGARPYRATEWIHVFEPAEEDRILLELDPGAAAISVSREYVTLAGDPVVLDHRWVRIGTMFRYDRNLAWERGFLREFYPAEFPDLGSPDCRGGEAR